MIRRHVQAPRLQLLIVEVEDEEHVCGQGSQVAGVVWRWKVIQDRCTNFGGDAHEEEDIHMMLHRHEPTAISHKPVSKRGSLPSESGTSILLPQSS